MFKVILKSGVVLGLFLTGCTPIKVYTAKLDNGESLTYNCRNYTYQMSNSIETVLYSEFNPISVKIKQLCENQKY